MRNSRPFVVAFVLVMVALAVFAALSITRGWADEDFQNRLRQSRTEREAAEG